MRKGQLEIRHAQAAQLVILQQILLALNGEGSLTDTASAVNDLLTRTQGQQVDEHTSLVPLITQSQALTPRQSDPNAGKDSKELMKPPLGGER